MLDFIKDNPLVFLMSIFSLVAIITIILWVVLRGKARKKMENQEVQAQTEKETQDKLVEEPTKENLETETITNEEVKEELDKKEDEVENNIQELDNIDNKVDQDKEDNLENSDTQSTEKEVNLVNEEETEEDLESATYSETATEDETVTEEETEIEENQIEESNQVDNTENLQVEEENEEDFEKEIQSQEKIENDNQEETETESVKENEEETEEETENMEEKVMEQETEVVAEKTRYVGKWVIVQKAEKEFIGLLKASNGQIVLTSESYSSEKSIVSGIETIRKNVANGNFQIYTDKKGKYFYKLKDSGNKLLCIGEVYDTRLACEKSVESVKKFAEKSVISPDIVEDLTMIYYKPATEEVTEDESQIKDQYRGKWIISKDEEGMYSATLLASNGQVLLNTEKYKLVDSVNKAIENYKKNSSENNFIIDQDKKGRFYYKLRNSQKLTLAVGETYNTQKACEAAIESFKRFNRIARIIHTEDENLNK